MSTKAMVYLMLLALWGAVPGSLVAAGPRVEIEIFQTGPVSPTVPQEWMRVLSDVGFSNPRIRSARGGDKIEITTTGVAPSITYRVMGALGSDGRIQLSARDTFRRGDRAGLQSWVSRLKEHGPGGPPVKGEFDLTAEQFAQVKRDLSAKVRKSTKGQLASALVKQLGARLKYPLRIDRSAQAALQRAGDVENELQGFAIGTSLAATLRVAGLAMRPELSAGKLEYVVVQDGRGVEKWPIGRRPKKRDVDALPRLLDFQQTQAVRMPLVLAMDEMGKQVGASVLWDHKTIAQKKIDLTTAEITMDTKRRYMKKILLRILSQAELRFKVREDDAGRIFLWIIPN